MLCSCYKEGGTLSSIYPGRGGILYIPEADFYSDRPWTTLSSPHTQCSPCPPTLALGVSLALGRKASAHDASAGLAGASVLGPALLKHSAPETGSLQSTWRPGGLLLRAVRDPALPARDTSARPTDLLAEERVQGAWPQLKQQPVGAGASWRFSCSRCRGSGHRPSCWALPGVQTHELIND